ncbi:hypothetical protein HMPREF1554_00989, partial [Porphyromonas gingivalis F0569]
FFQLIARFQYTRKFTVRSNAFRKAKLVNSFSLDNDCCAYT